MKKFRVGSQVLELPQRADIALWKDAKAEWQGALQDDEGDVPDVLQALCKNWTRLRVPKCLE